MASLTRHTPVQSPELALEQKILDVIDEKRPFARSPFATMTVDVIGGGLPGYVYCRPVGATLGNNDGYRYPFPANLELKLGDIVLVCFAPSGRFIVMKYAQNGGTDTGGVPFLDRVNTYTGTNTFAQGVTLGGGSYTPPLGEAFVYVQRVTSSDMLAKFIDESGNVLLQVDSYGRILPQGASGYTPGISNQLSGLTVSAQNTLTDHGGLLKIVVGASDVTPGTTRMFTISFAHAWSTYPNVALTWNQPGASAADPGSPRFALSGGSSFDVYTTGTLTHAQTYLVSYIILGT